jgi:hypothetical protein
MSTSTGITIFTTSASERQVNTYDLLTGALTDTAFTFALFLI